MLRRVASPAGDESSPGFFIRSLTHCTISGGRLSGFSWEGGMGVGWAVLNVSIWGFGCCLDRSFLLDASFDPSPLPPFATKSLCIFRIL